MLRFKKKKKKVSYDKSGINGRACIILILYHEELNEKKKKKKESITFIVKRYNSQNNWEKMK